MSAIIAQTVAKKEGDEDDRTASLELLDDLYGGARTPFDPESCGLPADFRLTKFSDSRKTNPQLERRERESLLDLFQRKEVILLRYHVEQNRVERNWVLCDLNNLAAIAVLFRQRVFADNRLF